jgi:hypothetical protein
MTKICDFLPCELACMCDDDLTILQYSELYTRHSDINLGLEYVINRYVIEIKQKNRHVLILFNNSFEINVKLICSLWQAVSETVARNGCSSH